MRRRLYAGTGCYCVDRQRFRVSDGARFRCCRSASFWRTTDDDIMANNPRQYIMTIPRSTVPPPGSSLFCPWHPPQCNTARAWVTSRPPGYILRPLPPRLLSPFLPAYWEKSRRTKPTHLDDGVLLAVVKYSVAVPCGDGEDGDPSFLSYPSAAPSRSADARVDSNRPCGCCVSKRISQPGSLCMFRVPGLAAGEFKRSYQELRFPVVVRPSPYLASYDDCGVPRCDLPSVRRLLVGGLLSARGIKYSGIHNGMA